MLIFFLALFAITANEAKAVPVVPSFTQGSMNSHTETSTKITELIKSVDYNTGYTYSVSGENVAPSSGRISPNAAATNIQVDAETQATWTQADLASKPDWKIVSPGGSFQFVEHYTAPGLANVTLIDRTIETQSVTDTVSIFQR
jgi:hypothetical protein